MTVTPETLARWELERRSPSAARDLQAKRAGSYGRAASNALFLSRHCRRDGDDTQANEYLDNASIWARLAWKSAQTALAIQATGRCRKAPPWNPERS